MACRYRTGRVALRETARLKIVPQVREEGKRPPLGKGLASLSAKYQPDLMGDHVRLRELAGFAAAAVEARLQVLEKRRVKINVFIVGAIERPHPRSDNFKFADANPATCTQS
jgi:hypothetical protein